MDRMAGPFGDGGVIGQIQGSHSGGVAMGRQNQIETESLRCLHRAQPRPRRGRGDKSLAPISLIGVGERHTGNSGTVGFCCGDRQIN